VHPSKRFVIDVGRALHAPDFNGQDLYVPYRLYYLCFHCMRFESLLLSQSMHECL